MITLDFHEKKKIVHNSRSPLVRLLNTTVRTLCGFFIFVQTLKSHSERKDNCSDEHHKPDYERHSGRCIQQMNKKKRSLMKMGD